MPLKFTSNSKPCYRRQDNPGYSLSIPRDYTVSCMSNIFACDQIVFPSMYLILLQDPKADIYLCLALRHNCYPYNQNGRQSRLGLYSIW